MNKEKDTNVVVKNKKINNSIYELIENHNSKKYADYYGKYYLSPACCIFATGWILFLDSCSKKFNEFMNSISVHPIGNPNFGFAISIMGIGTILGCKNILKDKAKFINAKYSLKRNGLSAGVYSLKKAQTVVYNIYTDEKGVTNEHRGIIINKNKKKQLILREVKKYILEEDDYKPKYYITKLDSFTDPKELEKQVILYKAKSKYKK